MPRVETRDGAARSGAFGRWRQPGRWWWWAAQLAVAAAAGDVKRQRRQQRVGGGRWTRNDAATAVSRGSDAIEGHGAGGRLAGGLAGGRAVRARTRCSRPEITPYQVAS